MVTQASSAAKVYSDDREVVRGITVPEHLGGAPAGGMGGASGGGGGKAADGLLPRPQFGDATITAAELHSVPQLSSGPEAGAEMVARRVRERREALQDKVRARINMYAPDELLAETAEEAEAHAKRDAEDGSSMLARALTGL